MVAKAKSTVLVTGANRGLGLEFVRQYINDGWNVIAACRTPEKARELKQMVADGAPVAIFQLDVTDAKSVARLAKGLKGKLIDVLVNNAGIVGRGGWPRAKAQTLGTMDIAVMNEVVDINVWGPARVADALYTNLKRAKGKIANISSANGSTSSAFKTKLVWRQEALAYSVSKAALNHFIVRASAQALKDKIVMIGLCPGWTRTDMGSQKATYAANDSVARLKKIIDKASMKDTGRFIDRNGKDIPW